jgi:hypothetical protein
MSEGAKEQREEPRAKSMGAKKHGREEIREG